MIREEKKVRKEFKSNHLMDANHGRPLAHSLHPFRWTRKVFGGEEQMLLTVIGLSSGEVQKAGACEGTTTSYCLMCCHEPHHISNPDLQSSTVYRNLAVAHLLAVLAAWDTIVPLPGGCHVRWPAQNTYIIEPLKKSAKYFALTPISSWRCSQGKGNLECV